LFALEASWSEVLSFIYLIAFLSGINGQQVCYCRVGRVLFIDSPNSSLIGHCFKKCPITNKGKTGRIDKINPINSTVSINKPAARLYNLEN